MKKAFTKLLALNLALLMLLSLMVPTAYADVGPNGIKARKVFPAPSGEGYYRIANGDHGKIELHESFQQYALVPCLITQSSLPRYGGYVRGERLTPMPGSSVDETLTESASAVYFLNEDSAAHAGEVPNMGQSYDYGYSTYFSWGFGSEQYFESLKDIYSIERIRPSINETTISSAPSGAYVYKSNKELKLFGDNMEIYLGCNKLEKEYVYGVGDQYILKANTEYYIVIDGGKYDDSVDDLPPFTDVEKGKFYYEPVIWAVDNGITSGTGDGTTFSPDMICTRAQVVTFLWRAKGSPEPQSSVNPFVDVKTGSYYHKAVLWAVEQGITNGTGDGTTFSPDMECTRAQVATFLWRTVGKPDVGNKTHPFRDIEAGSYYYDAVLWAVEAGVTNGTGDGTTFSPNKSCSRSEIVTFLYRALK